MKITDVLYYVAKLKTLAPEVLRAVVAVCDFVPANPWASFLVPDSIEQYLPAVKAACRFILDAGGDEQLLAAAPEALKAMSGLTPPTA